MLIQVQDNVGVWEVSVEIDGEIGMAEPLEDPCGLWRYLLNETFTGPVKIFAKDGMGNVGEWKGTLAL